MFLSLLVPLAGFTALVSATAHEHSSFSAQHPFLPEATKPRATLGEWNKAAVLPDLRGHARNNGAFSPSVDDLGALSHYGFAMLQHDAYPKHSVRVKKSKFCDGTVDAYTGYIDIEARHLFFYFFESRSDPDKDDVMFWTNGGPGGSSAMGLFMELGPCLIKDANTTTFNPHSWNENANIFFIDQPIGVGFSHADHGETVFTTEQAAVDIAAFMFIFFEHFSKFKGRALHMAGESYGGRYIPLFSSAIVDLNTRLVDGGYTPINLASAMIGNGLTDYVHWLTSIYDIQCTPASLPPIQSISACVRMKQAVPRCRKMLQASCVDQLDQMDCSAATSFCRNELGVPYTTLERNPYDISKKCEGGGDVSCYPLTAALEAYLSSPSTQHAIGVDDAVRGNFSMINMDVNELFWARNDAVPSATTHVAALLERGVRVLAYVGDYDFVCNWVGIERWTRELEWTGGEQFANQPLRVWKVDGAEAGKVRSYGNFTYATVHGAGHLVPTDKPKESLAMVQRWLTGQNL